MGDIISYTHVTAVGSGYCTLVLLNDYSYHDRTTAYVSCFTAAGVPADRAFHRTYLTASPYE